jgi:hypothetical protein
MYGASLSVWKLLVPVIQDLLHGLHRETDGCVGGAIERFDEMVTLAKSSLTR